MILNKVYQGHALSILKTLVDESVDCVVTSPPYYGLRSYGTEPQIWLNGNPDCGNHEWETVESGLLHENRNGLSSDSVSQKTGVNGKHRTETNFCKTCHAWKGELGLEPTFELYLNHLWQIFDEIKRVLKKTGTCWVNLGDSYGGSGGSTGHTSETKNLGRKTFDYGAYPTQTNTSKYQAKSLLQIPSRFSIGMTDPNYVLREDLTEEERSYVYSELIKRGII